MIKLTINKTVCECCGREKPDTVTIVLINKDTVDICRSCLVELLYLSGDDELHG